MTIDSIENVIRKIKEKANKNPKYLHPMNKELQEDAKIFGFSSTGRYIVWLQQNGILKNPTDVLNKEINEWAKDKGFEDYNDYQRKERRDYKREWTRESGWNNGAIPMEFNQKCASNLGVYKAEELFKRFLEKVVFEYTEKTGYHDGGIDFKCKNPRQEFIGRYPHLGLDKLRHDEECSLQLKSRCITFDNKSAWSGWKFSITGNVDYHMLCMFDNRDNLEPLHILMFHKNSMVRKGKGGFYHEEFWKRSAFTITNTPFGISQIEKYELKDELSILKELSKELSKELPR